MRNWATVPMSQNVPKCPKMSQNDKLRLCSNALNRQHLNYRSKDFLPYILPLNLCVHWPILAVFASVYFMASVSPNSLTFATHSFSFQMINSPFPSFHFLSFSMSLPIPFLFPSFTTFPSSPSSSQLFHLLFTLSPKLFSQTPGVTFSFLSLSSNLQISSSPSSSYTSPPPPRHSVAPSFPPPPPLPPNNLPDLIARRLSVPVLGLF